MVARSELFPQPLSWQVQATPPALDTEKSKHTVSASWREQLGSPQTKVLVALGIGMVLGWIIKRSR